MRIYRDDRKGDYFAGDITSFRLDGCHYRRDARTGQCTEAWLFNGAEVHRRINTDAYSAALVEVRQRAYGARQQ